MSGHSKWSTIKRKKGAADAKRGQLFSKLSKAISVAARSGKNLEIAVEAAKAANMPKDNIDRAIKRGTGEGLDSQIEEIVYEAYGPGGAAILITTLTDNRNRTVNELRALANKLNFRLADSGSVKYLFDLRGVVEVETGEDPDITQLTLIDAGFEEIDDEGDLLVGYIGPNQLSAALQAVQSKVKVTESQLAFIPKTAVALSANQQAQLVKILESVEELDDVSSVETNAELNPDAQD